jgi:hypothetical protein
VGPHQSFCLYANTRTGCRRSNPRASTNIEILLFLNLVGFFWGEVVFLFSFSWVFCLFVYYCGVFIFIFIPIFLFFLSLLSTLPSPSSHPYSHSLHSTSFSYVKIHCSSFQIFFLPLPIHCLTWSTPSPPILSQPVKRLPLPPTHLPPADQPMIPTLHNSNTLQSLTQASYTTITEIHPNTQEGHKTQQPLHCIPTYPPLFWPPLLVPPYVTPQISIANVKNINPQLPLLIDIITNGSST